MDARMDGRMDRRHAEANSKFTPGIISHHRVYLYYKTAINSGIHYHKLDRHRVVHVSDGMPRETE